MNNPLIKVLSVRPFLYLLLSEIFSQVSMNLFNFILLIIAFALVHSNTAVAGVVLSFTLPSLLFGIIAGIFVDKWNKKNVLFWSNLLRGIFSLPLVFLSSNIWMVYILSFMVSLATQFFIPAEAPIIPHLVPKKLLLSANALFSIVIFGSVLIAYAASGPILLFFGKTNIFLLLSVLFLISAFFAFLIKLKIPEKVDAHANIKSDLISTLSLISKTKNIYHALFLITLLQTLILVIAVIGPGYAESILHIQVESFPILFVTPAVIGMAIGAVVVGNFLHTRPKSFLTKIGLLVMGVTIMIFPYGEKLTSREIIKSLNAYLPHIAAVDILHFMMAMAVVLGFAFAFVFIPSNTILQEETSDELRGKIYGSLNTLVGAISLFPVLAVGSLADVFGVAKVLTTIGIIVLSIGIVRIIVD